MSMLLAWALATRGRAARAARPFGPARPGAPGAPRVCVQHLPPAADVAPGDWKAANDTVRRIGGWKAYAREAAASEPRR